MIKVRLENIAMLQRIPLGPTDANQIWRLKAIPTIATRGDKEQWLNFVDQPTVMLRQGVHAVFADVCDWGAECTPLVDIREWEWDGSPPRVGNELSATVEIALRFNAAADGEDSEVLVAGSLAPFDWFDLENPTVMRDARSGKRAGARNARAMTGPISGYLVFAGDWYYPCAGWSDYIRCFADRANAAKFAHEVLEGEDEWVQVVELATGRVWRWNDGSH
jgi:hypothetical protein